jgi:catechol 2,3-dioxygenase-like lactoylglutathione lyase family enzyme
MKYLHAMVRVRDLDASLHFYRDALGLVETRRREAVPNIPPGWIKQWEGARPGDRSDRFHLYVRPRQ